MFPAGLDDWHPDSLPEEFEGIVVVVQHPLRTA